jgi:hypothetical protein
MITKVLVVAALVCAILAFFTQPVLGMTPDQEAALGVGLLCVAVFL